MSLSVATGMVKQLASGVMNTYMMSEQMSNQLKKAKNTFRAQRRMVKLLREHNEKSWDSVIRVVDSHLDYLSGLRAYKRGQRKQKPRRPTTSPIELQRGQRRGLILGTAALASIGAAAALGAGGE